MESALHAFGPTRLLFGSDWPVCRVATTYSDWVRTVERFAQSLSEDERKALFHSNAVRAYNLAI
jgi:L-fuconolactonase